VSTTITIPAWLTPAVRNGLYEELQVTYEALDYLILAPDRDNPDRAPEQQRLLDQFTAAISALQAAGPSTHPPQPLTISIAEHGSALLRATRAAASTEGDITAELPAENPRRQQAKRAITALHELAQEIETHQSSNPPEDLYLQRLLILAVLDQGHPEGRTSTELHQDLEDYPAEEVDHATSQLAAIGLLRTGERIQPTGGLERIEELGLICI
jgi:hypothetical protein